MKRIIIDSVKVSIAVAIAIAIANILQLEYAISAGIVAVLSIRPTKRETLSLATGRLVAFIIALLIAAVSYRIFGFTQLAFWIYIIPYVFICYIKKWTAAIAMNSVLVSHFLTYQCMDMEHILNEVLIFGIGVSVGILMNLNLHHKDEYVEKLKTETDEQIRKILKVIAHRIQDKNAPDYTTDCFLELEHLMREAKNAAEENYNNKLRNRDKKDMEYIAMRQKQYNVLLDMYKTVRTLQTKPNTAQLISDFFEQMAEEFHRENDGKKLMEEFRKMDAEMKKRPLPIERQEFEDRARLFIMMRYIEEFIMIKMEFSSIKGGKQYEKEN